MATFAEMDVDKLIRDNMGLVYNIISTQFFQYINDDDMIQCGRIGLWKAAKTFNPDLGFQFSSYAGTCIENEIKMEYRRNSRVVPPYITGFISMDSPIASDEFGTSFVSDTIADTTDFIEESEIMNLIHSAINDLNARDKEIIQLWIEDKNQSEIGEITQLSQSYVSRRLKAIMKQIKQKLDS